MRLQRMVLEKSKRSVVRRTNFHKLRLSRYWAVRRILATSHPRQIELALTFKATYGRSSHPRPSRSWPSIRRFQRSTDTRWTRMKTKQLTKKTPVQTHLRGALKTPLHGKLSQRPYLRTSTPSARATWILTSTLAKSTLSERTPTCAGLNNLKP